MKPTVVRVAVLVATVALIHLASHWVSGPALTATVVGIALTAIGVRIYLHKHCSGRGCRERPRTDTGRVDRP